MKRRSLLKTLAAAPALVLAPEALLAAHHNEAKKGKAKAGAPANLLSETEGMGKMFNYKNDATKAKRIDKNGICGNCTKWNICHPEDKTCKSVKADAPYAPCSSFSGGKVVAKGGYCMAYAKNG